MNQYTQMKEMNKSNVASHKLDEVTTNGSKKFKLICCQVGQYFSIHPTGQPSSSIRTYRQYRLESLAEPSHS